MIGSLNPWDAKRLYMALIDPHLTHGCEIAIDTPECRALLGLLEIKQKSFIRRVLGLHARSPIAPLHSETGIYPLQYRRIMIALRYLKYLTGLPRSRLVRVAFDDSVLLLGSGQACWLGDILHALQSLPVPVAVKKLETLLTEDGIKYIETLVNKSLELFLLEAIRNNDSLYLLQDRWDTTGDSEKRPRIIAIQFRSYLSIPCHKHRVALIQLLTGCHELAVERAKWLKGSDGKDMAIPRNDRVCRLCRQAVETPEHALLECDQNTDLNSLRSAFWTKIRASLPEVPAVPMAMPSSAKAVKWLIVQRGIAQLLGKFAFQVTEIYKSHPMFIPQVNSDD